MVVQSVTGSNDVISLDEWMKVGNWDIFELWPFEKMSRGQ
jgi:hypothetical protein